MFSRFKPALENPRLWVGLAYVLPAIFLSILLVAAALGQLRSHRNPVVAAYDEDDSFWQPMEPFDLGANFLTGSFGEVSDQLLAAHAEATYCEVSLEDIPNRPQFEDYPATRTISNPRRPRLNSRLARNYRSVLRNGMAEGPNFAGDSRVVSWGCGSACFEWAIVNGRTGTVYFPPEEIASHFGPSHFRDAALHFRHDSRLLITVGSHIVLHPEERPMETWYEGAFFLLWNGRTLRPLRIVPVTDFCPDTGPHLLPSRYNFRDEEPPDSSPPDLSYLEPPMFAGTAQVQTGPLGFDKTMVALR
jgi:hypothetical protein